MIHCDTSFLVDLLRESARSHPGPAHGLLDALHGHEIVLSVFAACELYVGVERSANPLRERARVEELTGFLGIVYPDERFASVYARLLAGLQRGGEIIATMDLMIATAAVVDEASLVTRNRRHFDRVPGVDVVSY